MNIYVIIISISYSVWNFPENNHAWSQWNHSQDWKWPTNFANMISAKLMKKIKLFSFKELYRIVIFQRCWPSTFTCPELYNFVSITISLVLILYFRMLWMFTLVDLVVNYFIFVWFSDDYMTIFFNFFFLSVTIFFLVIYFISVSSIICLFAVS